MSALACLEKDNWRPTELRHADEVDLATVDLVEDGIIVVVVEDAA